LDVSRNCEWRSVVGIDYTGVLTKVEAHIEEHDAVVEAHEVARSKPVGRLRRIAMLVLVIPLLAGTGIVWVPIATGALNRESVYAIGQTSDAPGLKACLRRLWEVRGALDHYRSAHEGALPEKLSMLSGGRLVNCPATGKPWSYEVGDDGSYRVACPDPGSLGQYAIFLDDRYGPPQVLTDAQSEPSP